MTQLGERDSIVVESLGFRKVQWDDDDHKECVVVIEGLRRVIERVIHKSGDPKINLSHTNCQYETAISAERGVIRIYDNPLLTHSRIHIPVCARNSKFLTLTYTRWGEAEAGGTRWKTSIKSILPVSDHTLRFVPHHMRLSISASDIPIHFASLTLARPACWHEQQRRNLWEK